MTLLPMQYTVPREKERRLLMVQIVIEARTIFMGFYTM
jgi:hypothetical protein